MFRNNILIALLLLATLISCHKDEIIFTPDQESTVNQHLLLGDLGIKPLSSSVELTEGRSVYDLSDGWKINIPSGSITYESGKIYSGTLRVEYLAINKNDLNLLQAPSTWSGQDPLAVNRMFYYRLNLEEKGLKSIQPIFLLKLDDQVNNYVGPVLAFDFQKNHWKKIESEFQFKYGNWEVPDIEGTKEVAGYNIPVLEGENWMLSLENRVQDFYYENSINIKLSNQFNSKNTSCFLVSLENMQVLRLSGDKNTSNFTARNFRFNAAIRYKVITLSEMGDGKYYFGMTNVVESRNEYFIENNLLSKEELIKQLQEL